jgi:hypothetical protein
MGLPQRFSIWKPMSKHHIAPQGGSRSRSPCQSIILSFEHVFSISNPMPTHHFELQGGVLHIKAYGFDIGLSRPAPRRFSTRGASSPHAQEAEHRQYQRKQARVCAPGPFRAFWLLVRGGATALAVVAQGAPTAAHGAPTSAGATTVAALRPARAVHVPL